MKKTLNYFYYSCSAGEGKKNLANPVRNWSLWVSNGAKINEKAHIPGFFQLIIGVEILPLRLRSGQKAAYSVNKAVAVMAKQPQINFGKKEPPV